MVLVSSKSPSEGQTYNEIQTRFAVLLWWWNQVTFVAVRSKLVHMGEKYMISLLCDINPYAQLLLTAENEPSKVRDLACFFFRKKKKTESWQA